MKFGQFPAGMQHHGDVPWRSRMLGLLGKQQKKLMISWKKCFLDAIVFVLHIYYFFYWKNKYSKVLHRDIQWTSTEPSCGTSHGPKNGDIHGMSVIYVFLNSTQKHIKLTLTAYSKRVLMSPRRYYWKLIWGSLVKFLF